MAGEDGEEEEGIVPCFPCKSRGWVFTMENSSDTCTNCGGEGPRLCNVNGASELRQNKGACIQNNLTDLLLPTSHSAIVPERGQICYNDVAKEKTKIDWEKREKRTQESSSRTR